MSPDKILNTIICGDNVTIMQGWPDECIDLIITSPPYNLGVTTGGGFSGDWHKEPLRQGNGSRWNPRPFKQVGGKWNGGHLANGYESHTDAMSPEEYIKWQKTFLTEAWRLIKPTGAIFYNHKPRVQSGILQMPLELNPSLPIRQIIIWKRAGGVNFSTTHYLPVHEWIIIFAKPDFRLKSQGASGMSDVWEFTQESNNPHPAPFPVELPARIIETVNPGLILDPFMGSGTTAIAAIKAGKNWIGIDNSPEYCKLARRRIANIERELRGEWKPLQDNGGSFEGLPLLESIQC